MKRVLIVKMSSMGDVIHTLPALTDARNIYPDIEFDWVVEPSFAEIPKWHKAVKTVIPAPLRKLRKAPWQTFMQGEWHALHKRLCYTSYDAVIDAQGLVKSALVAKFAQGQRFGFDRSSAREGIASVIYHKKIAVPKGQHAVERVRQLFANIFHYPNPTTPPDYGIDKQRLADISYGNKTILFLHGTTWPTKHWPENYWCLLAHRAASEGYQVLLPWGNDNEKSRAEKIKQYCYENAIDLLPEVLPKLSLGELTSLIAKARGIVAVDTGLGHVAAAMAVPTVSLYGPTDPKLTGAYGPKQHHLQVQASCSPCLARVCKQGTHFAVMPPCFESLSPEKVWNALLSAMVVMEPQPITGIY